MGIKYKLRLKDLKLEYLIEYFKPFLKYFRPQKKINNYEDLKDFIQKRCAWVSQETLYGYLKSRMGAKYVLLFEDEGYLGSINKAKWNIYAVSLQDICFYTITYMKNCYSKLHSLYLGAQDCSKFKDGAYTGEISAFMLRENNCKFCIVGHSERRQVFNEHNEDIKLKAEQLLNERIIPIICIGETLEKKK